MRRYFYLTPVLGGPGAPRYPITRENQIIGRSEDASIALLEPTVSREHAAIHCLDRTIQIQDLDSKHGTYVNSKRITTKAIKVGDIVVFGLSLVLRLEESDEPVPRVILPANDEPTAPRARLDTDARRRRGTTGAHHRERGSRRASGPGLKNRAMAEVARARDTTVKLNKLAAVGALAADQLPDVQRRLYELSHLLASGDIQPKDAAATVSAAVAALETLVSAAGVGRPQLDPAALATVVDGALVETRSVAQTKSLQLTSEIPNQLTVLTDSTRLRYGLGQLLRAAFEAAAPASSVQLRAHQGLDSASLDITGDFGLPTNMAQRLFDPFITLPDEWAPFGVGLFEARQIIATLGGSLALVTRPGMAAIFQASLPLA